MACHLKIDADPDPACHFDAGADPDPAYHFEADPDPDPTFQFDADPSDPDQGPQHCLREPRGNIYIHSFK